MVGDSLFNVILSGTGETLLMVLLSTALGYFIGLPMGILLTVSDSSGIAPNAFLYKILDGVVNITRSIPFLILLILIQPITKLIVGKSYGTVSTVVPLTVAAAPLIARMVESSLKEVDKGVIEAAISMGAGKLLIVNKVLIPEAKISLLIGVTISLGTILGYSAMAGVVGGGGLGDIAIRYGYYRYETKVMLITVFVLVLLMQVLQYIGNYLSKRYDRRKA
ncbi:MAG: ABC transporter permease [Lachnospiraceae bacterium]|nr:ABC transporter permease [Lachnospiraceae bacterium]